MNQIDQYVDKLAKGTISRRGFMKQLIALGISVPGSHDGYFPRGGDNRRGVSFFQTLRHGHDRHMRPAESTAAHSRFRSSDILSP